MKFCPKCQNTKELSAFAKNKAKKDGYSDWCKVCVKSYNKNYYEANKDKIKNSVKEYRHENQDLIRARKREYHSKNAAKILSKVNAWKKANPEKVSKNDKKFRSKHKEQIASYAHARRARLRANGVFSITEKEIKRLYSKPCFYCGSFEKIQIDHILPISKGGSHSLGNLVSACQKCNLDKSDQLLIVWKMKNRKEQTWQR